MTQVLAFGIPPTGSPVDARDTVWLAAASLLGFWLWLSRSNRRQHIRQTGIHVFVGLWLLVVAAVVGARLATRWIPISSSVYWVDRQAPNDLRHEISIRPVGDTIVFHIIPGLSALLIAAALSVSAIRLTQPGGVRSFRRTLPPPNEEL